MKMTFRWYGEGDPVTLENISQIPGMSGIVSAVYSVAPGGVWGDADIAAIKTAANAKNLEFEVVESVPVHEDIKLGKPTRDTYIENYCKNIRALAKAGVKCICYNFMPVFDWLRSELDHKNADGSTSLIYREDEVLALDPNTKRLSLPGWDESYTQEGLRELLSDYKSVDEEALWRNLEYFLQGIIPTCEECGVNMAIHPDDPPWGIFGLPRIITCGCNLDRMMKLVDKKENGITLCTGSLGCSSSNDVVSLIRHFGEMGRIHFVHARNIKITGARDFNETSHLSSDGSLDMYEIVKALHDVNFEGYIRPDHGRMIWGEVGRPGYGLFDRALGAAYLNGLIEAVSKK